MAYPAYRGQKPQKDLDTLELTELGFSLRAFVLPEWILSQYPQPGQPRGLTKLWVAAT